MQIATEKDEIEFKDEYTHLSDELAADMWTPESTIEACGCLHDTITLARYALADFWAQDLEEGDDIEEFEVEELSEFLSGVNMDGYKVKCPVSVAQNIVTGYLGLEIID